MKPSNATLAVLIVLSLPIGQAQAYMPKDDPSPVAAKPVLLKVPVQLSPKEVAAQVHATLSYTECVAKLLGNGLGAWEARQLCIDSVATN